jgi:hypothetical protein
MHRSGLYYFRRPHRGSNFLLDFDTHRDEDTPMSTRTTQPTRKATIHFDRDLHDRFAIMARTLGDSIEQAADEALRGWMRRKQRAFEQRVARVEGTK